jgi:integrase
LRADAERLLKQRLGEIATGKFFGVTSDRLRITGLLNLVVSDYEYSGKKSAPEVKWRLEKHVRPALGDVRAVEFGSQQIKRYIAKRRQAEASDATINRELSIVRRAFTLALQNDPPLVSRAPHIPKLQEHNARQGFIEHAQYLQLRQHLPDHLRAIFVVGYHVGVRLGELRQLQWSQVDAAAGEIRLSGEQTKSGKPRTVPIYGDMRTWLEWQRDLCNEKWPDCPWVFQYLGRPIGGHLKGWKKACESAGLPALLFHDLRRSAVRNMERAGIPRNVAMGISGHRTESVYRRYDIVSKQDLCSAGVRMEGYGLREAARASVAMAEAITKAARESGRALTEQEHREIASLKERAAASLRRSAQFGALAGFGDTGADLGSLGPSLGTSPEKIQ